MCLTSFNRTLCNPSSGRLYILDASIVCLSFYYLLLLLTHPASDPQVIYKVPEELIRVNKQRTL